MFNVKKILVPTDFSEESYKALKKAADIAETFNSEIILLHVKVTDVGIVEQYLSEEIIKELSEKTNSDIEKNFEKQIKECVKEGIKVLRSIKDGIPYQEILKAENEFDVDFIVIASHTKTFFEDVLFGSTTEKVVRRSKKSVLVIRN